MKKCYVVIGFMCVLFFGITCLQYSKHSKQFEKASVVDVSFCSIEQQQELAKSVSKKARCSIGIADNIEYSEFVRCNPGCNQYIVFSEKNGLMLIEYGNGCELPKSKVIVGTADYQTISRNAIRLIEGNKLPDEFMKLVCIVACIFGTAEVIDFQYVKHWKLE